MLLALPFEGQVLYALAAGYNIDPINSGLMYQVLNPAFAHHEWLVSWYWALPYIVALYIMKNLPQNTNRTYILYVGISMIGLAFIAFMTVEPSAGAYLLVNTLMLEPWMVLS